MARGIYGQTFLYRIWKVGNRLFAQAQASGPTRSFLFIGVQAPGFQSDKQSSPSQEPGKPSLQVLPW